MITAAFLIVILFLGGWHFWGLTGGGDEPITWPVALLRVVVLLAKVLGVILFFMLARWSWPRFRFDQLMNLAWKVMLPLGLVNLVAVAVVVEYRARRRPASAADQRVAGRSASAGRVALVAWLVAALFAPLHTDNRPRMDACGRRSSSPSGSGPTSGTI